MSKVHLVIPDSHAHPDHNNDRYDLLGQLVAELRPDVIIDIGDFWDMASLCTYDKGKRGFENRRYSLDISAGIDAQDRLLAPLKKLRRKAPRKIRCLGNHEHRINRVLETDPVLDGTIGLRDLQSKEYGFEEYPFLEIVEVDGIQYSHYFASGVMGRPIGGVNLGAAILSKQLNSATQGHSHLFDHAVRVRGNGQRLHGLSCGVFQDYVPPFARASARYWSSGVVIKRGVENGDYDLEWVSMRRLKEIYGPR
jgi:predicted MPP superfamily phosphohydrolase